ncbi:MAG: AI-2E family transporter, partial [Alistipes sp.]|nr:AI-2E family transporter [Alistipes sp.]
STDFLRTFSSVARSMVDAFISVFSVSFITFFFLKEDGLFYSMVTLFFPERYKHNVVHALDSITHLLSRYFGGLMFESLVLMVVISTVMALWGLRLDDALFIGLIMGIMNVIPYAGPFMGGLASVCVGIVTPIAGWGVGGTVAVIVFSLVCIKVMDDFVLQPTIYSKRVQAHPLEVFLVILIAGSVAGIWGMLLAIPSYTVLRVFAREL